MPIKTPPPALRDVIDQVARARNVSLYREES